MSFTAAISVKLMVVMQRMSGIHINGTALPQVLSGGAAEEAPLGGGKAVDILAVKNGKRIAFEIETGKSDAAANVQKCLDGGIDKVVVVATSLHTYKRLSFLLAGNPQVILSMGIDALHVFGD